MHVAEKSASFKIAISLNVFHKDICEYIYREMKGAYIVHSELIVDIRKRIFIFMRLIYAQFYNELILNGNAAFFKAAFH